ncbi:hypothetical protein K438DRAFT_2029214 [Mycena galopus ATCC 62051]|nr:hypothetical protein K438DRAFT_2029214 [Mycena galopus ATCC 62051]
MVLWFLSSLFKRVYLFLTWAQPERLPLSLVNVPLDILDQIFETLLALEAASETVTQQPYGHELCNSACLIPVSETCRHIRSVALPWIFREVYNWDRNGADVWPDTLWPFLFTIHIRDFSVRHPSSIPLTSRIFAALPKLHNLTRVTLRLQAAIPFNLLIALAAIPNLSELEILQLRLDGPPPPDDLSFQSLSSLLIGICGFEGVIRVPNIDLGCELRNVVILLRRLSRQLTTLCVSGDLLSAEFCDLPWPKLRHFTAMDHAPRPFIPVPRLVAHMHALHSLAVLFAADLSLDYKQKELLPPFRLGIVNGGLLADSCPLLTSVSLASMPHDDPIFAQLSSSVESLHLLPMRELHSRIKHRDLREVRFYQESAFSALEHIAHLDRLTELSFTVLQHAPTPEFIRTIALQFPRLRSLQLGYFIRLEYDMHLVELSTTAALFEALRSVHGLRHLKISLDIYWSEMDRGPPARAAYIWMQELPNLERISYRWRRSHTAVPDHWYTWDRSVLLRPPPDPLPTDFPDDENERA